MSDPDLSVQDSGLSNSQQVMEPFPLQEPLRDQPIAYYQSFLEDLEGPSLVLNRSCCRLTWLQGRALLFAQEAMGKGSKEWARFLDELGTKHKGFSRSNCYLFMKIARNIPRTRVDEFNTIEEMLAAASPNAGKAIERDANEFARMINGNFGTINNSDPDPDPTPDPNEMDYSQLARKMSTVAERVQKLANATLVKSRSGFDKALAALESIVEHGEQIQAASMAILEAAREHLAALEGRMEDVA